MELDRFIMSSSENSAAPAAEMAAALAQLWQKFLPQLEERVAVLESAAAPVSPGQLTAEQRAEAHMAAHKLAGSLGTFGLASGTALAREAELLCSGDEGIETDARQRLAEIAAQLRIIVADGR